jgi:Right handed beta helix region
MVSRDGILKIVGQNAGDPEAVVSGLIRAANDAGGKDNVTVVYIPGAGPAQTQENAAPQTDPTVLSQHKTSALSGAVDKGQGTLNKIRGAAAAMPKLLTSRWMMFIYGVVLTLSAVWLEQRYVRWGVVRQGDTEPRGEQKRFLIVNQGGESEYPDIGSALAAARAGDTIQIAPGEYHEQIQIKEGVTLVSVRPREAVIRLTKGAGGQAGVVATDVKTARIVGLKIIGDDSAPLAAGIRLIGSSVIVEDVEVAGARGPGIEIVGDGTSTLIANYIHDNTGGGVVIRGENARPRLAHNSIVGNGKSNGKGAPGIQLDDRARPTLLWNYLAGNGSEGITGLSDEVKEEVVRTNIFGQEGRENSTRQPSNRLRRR